MNWDKVGKQVKKVVPALGTALGGPKGAILGSVLANQLGVADTPSAVSIALDTAKGKTAVIDWASVNVNTIALYKEQALAARRKRWAKMGVLAAGAAFAVFLAFVEIPETNQGFMTQLIGLLRAGAELVLSE